MPVVEIVYSGLIRAAVPCQSETYELDAHATLRDLLTEVACRHGPEARRHLLDDASDLATGASILVDGFAAHGLNTRVGGHEQIQVVVLSPMMIGG
jgi:hypothetical protein